MRYNLVFFCYTDPDLSIKQISCLGFLLKLVVLIKKEIGAITECDVHKDRKVGCIAESWFNSLQQCLYLLECNWLMLYL